MQNAVPYEIPVYHPLVVHFPVALLIAAAVAALVWLAGGRSFWRGVVLFLYALATLGAAAAYVTGDTVAEQAEGVPVVELFVDRHALLARVTLILTAATFVGLAAVSFWLTRRTTLERDPPDPLWVRVVFALAALAAATLVAWTAHLGGTMVWGVPA